MLRKKTADAVVVGAGVAGCSAYYGLAKRSADGGKSSFKPLLLDAIPPMSLTSARGTYQYRNWWPDHGDEAMMRLVSRSIDMMDQVAQDIDLNRNGYLFVTRDTNRIEAMKAQAKRHAALGGGAFREHIDLSGYNPSTRVEDRLDGCDLIHGQDNIAKVFPSLHHANALAALHVRRAGSLNPQKLSQLQLKRAKELCPGAGFQRSKMVDIHTSGGRITGISVALPNGDIESIETPVVVLSPGPMLKHTLAMLQEKNLLQTSMTLNHELHARVIFDDPQQITTPSSPLTFHADPIGRLPFTPEEVRSSPDDPLLKKEFPGGVHVRPYIDGKAMAVWTYDIDLIEPVFPITKHLDPRFGEICMRGLTRLFPQVASYTSDPHIMGTINVDGGYYCKMIDNIPLIGRSTNSVDGLYFQAAMTGVGLMSSAAAGELLAATVLDDVRYGAAIDPSKPYALYADALSPARFDDVSYVASLSSDRQTSGQV
ncbi:unnamed protein product [Aphanomyces euteiches]|uniref:FAD-dependent oxidoreductase domain-containing protein 1 n=1 Tax=Aphanomyces euteiches TaxID=100861 RepID=A0A6G0XPU6_9STRA|nr:hypothetical protein Ae201684_002640 [Aphanomyces euteiches]KAH9092973.1 hypothetical protein Ae201684P_008639 [Aphanomyces euteiches]KAH9135559.1 hypothetical protein AeRB84_019073 [Aphanomyces euteiches]